MPEGTADTVDQQNADTQSPETTVLGADAPISVLAEDLRSDPNVGKYKTVGDLIKGHVETVKMVGRKGVILPGEKASPEELDKFYNTLGRPAKAEEYKSKPIEGLHEKIKVTPESTAMFQGVAHKLGLTQAQYEGLNTWYLSTINDGMRRQDEQAVQETKEAETKLRNEWGEHYEQNITLASRVAQKFGGKDAIDAIGDMGRNPAIVRLLASVGKKLSEDSIARGEVSSLTGSPQDAAAKIKAVLADPKHPYFDENHPQHADWVGSNGEMQKLYKLAHGEA